MSSITPHALIQMQMQTEARTDEEEFKVMIKVSKMEARVEEKTGFLFDMKDMVFIYERDMWFVHHLQNSCKGPVVVGVFGLKHIRGIVSFWNSNFPLDHLDTPSYQPYSRELILKTIHYAVGQPENDAKVPFLRNMKRLQKKTEGETKNEME